MSARYLVQVRQVGEPWLTVSRCDRLVTARRVAMSRSNERRNAVVMTFPYYAHVRVIHKGRLVFDPRKRESGLDNPTV